MTDTNMAKKSCDKQMNDQSNPVEDNSSCSSSTHQELVESIVTSYSDPEDGGNQQSSDRSCQAAPRELENQLTDQSNTPSLTAKESTSISSSTTVTAQLHRFYVSEVKSVRFGQLEDSTSTIIMIISTFVLVNAALMLWGTLVNKPIWIHFIQSSQFVAIFLLLGWIIAFNVISLTIHYQFERNDVLVADDFYIAAQEDNAIDSLQQQQQPCVVQMPDSQIVLAVPPKKVSSVASSKA